MWYISSTTGGKDQSPKFGKMAVATMSSHHGKLHNFVPNNKKKKMNTYKHRCLCGVGAWHYSGCIESEICLCLIM